MLILIHVTIRVKRNIIFEATQFKFQPFKKNLGAASESVELGFEQFMFHKWSKRWFI